MYIYIYIYIHVSTSLSIYIYIYTSISLSICVYVCVCIYIYIYIYMYIIYIHTYYTCWSRGGPPPDGGGGGGESTGPVVVPPIRRRDIACYASRRAPQTHPILYESRHTRRCQSERARDLIAACAYLHVSYHVICRHTSSRRHQYERADFDVFSSKLSQTRGSNK